jgi:hypothetical protein
MLENILHDYFNLPEDWNDNYERKNENWYKAYDKLIQLVYDLGKMGALNSHKVISYIDEVDSKEE